MLGVYHVDKLRVQIAMSPALVQKIDTYRMSLITQPSRNFIIAEACVEYLKARGFEVQFIEEPQPS